MVKLNVVPSNNFLLKGIRIAPIKIPASEPKLKTQRPSLSKTSQALSFTFSVSFSVSCSSLSWPLSLSLSFSVPLSISCSCSCSCSSFSWSCSFFCSCSSSFSIFFFLFFSLLETSIINLFCLLVESILSVGTLLGSYSIIFYLKVF